MNDFGKAIIQKQFTRRNFLKVSLLGASALVIPSIVGVNPMAFADNLVYGGDGSDPVAQRLRDISDSYAVGEVLSPEDAEFIQRYAKSTSEPMTRGSQKISGTGGSQGTTVTVSGSAFHNGFGTYTWGFNVAVRKTKGVTPSSMRFVAVLTKYGAGDGGLFKAGTDTLSHSVSKKASFTASKSKSYNGLTAFYTIACRCEVRLPNGSIFTIA